MTKYTERPNSNSVTRNSDGMIICSTQHEKDWTEYQEWLKAGNKPNLPPNEHIHQPSQPTIEELQKQLNEIADKINALVNTPKAKK